jgi:hypothetical protein
MYTRLIPYTRLVESSSPQPREQKPKTCRCHRRHTWLSGATLLGHWSKIPHKVAVGYFLHRPSGLSPALPSPRGLVAEVLRVSAFALHQEE